MRDPKMSYSLATLAAAALIVAALVFGAHWHWLASWLLAINSIAFVAYVWDKTCARRGSFRIPEVTLHLLSVAGGAIGATAGHYLLRHKTRKLGFKLVYVASAVLWGGLLVWYLGP